MHRRTFLTTSAAFVTLATAGHAAPTMIDYTPGLIQKALDEGRTVLIDYSAKWCSTCARQERVLTQLRTENPDYDSAITFIKVDWDTYKKDAVTTSRGIPRRSTLVLLQGDQELGRLVAETRTPQIQALLDQALANGS